MAYDPEAEIKQYAELLVGVVKRHLVDDTVQVYAAKVTDADGAAWEVSFQRIDAETEWERSLSPEDKAALALAKLGHNTDLLDAIDKRIRNIQVAVYQGFIHTHGVKLFNEVMDPRGAEPRG